MGLRELRLLRGIALPNFSPAAYPVITHLTFSSVGELGSAMIKLGAEIMGDLIRFTTVQPTIEISEWMA